MVELPLSFVFHRILAAVLPYLSFAYPVLFCSLVHFQGASVVVLYL